MQSFPSDFVECTGTKAVVTNALALVYIKDRRKERYDAYHEIFIYKNGVDMAHPEDVDNLYSTPDAYWEMAEALSKELAEIKQSAEDICLQALTRQEKEQKEMAEKAATEAKKRNEAKDFEAYLALKKKFETATHEQAL